MPISVLPPSRHPPTNLATKFALKQDRWNDYSFTTLYHLYYKPEDSDSHTLIGYVKILRRGQTESDGILISKSFDVLPDDFCSVGNSLDYYQRLLEVPQNDRTTIVNALRDVVAFPDLRKLFDAEKGWGVSLFRDNPDPDGYLVDAAAIYWDNYSDVADISQNVSFTPAGWPKPIDLNFGAPEPSVYMGPTRKIGPKKVKVLLPRRIIVLIGRNGSGKSTLLSRIARVAFASPDDRSQPEMKAIGQFTPQSIGFMRVVAISYSAFDSFRVPSLFVDELRQVAEDVRKGRGRYVYAGLRDIVAEAMEDIQRSDTTPNTTDAREVIQTERAETTRLKPLHVLAEEFVRLVKEIDSNGDGELFDAALDSLLSDPSFIDVIGTSRESLLADGAREAFLSWSTGHKIALHVMASLVAHVSRKSLVLFDEPESHLHPPLIAALMNAVRVVLETKNAFAIVATHSPVILQETIAQHVRIVTRVGDQFDASVPAMETFGENVGILTQGVFGLTSAATDFYRTLDVLIESHNSIEEINALFHPGLSAQALAYLLAGRARKDRKP